MVIFNSYVKLPEGSKSGNSNSKLSTLYVIGHNWSLKKQIISWLESQFQMSVLECVDNNKQTFNTIPK